MPEPERNRPEVTNKQQYKKLIQMLRRRYLTSDVEEGKHCNLCGKQCLHLIQMSNGLLICEDCKNSEVTSIEMAAELLYTTYGNFKRLFPNTPFRYPDLEISQQSMHHIKDIAGGGSIVSRLLEVVNNTNDGFSLRIVKDIPYGFLEGLYAQVFSQQLEKAIWRGGRRDKRWRDYMKAYLESVGREQQMYLLLNE